jgi:carboxylesterase
MDVRPGAEDWFVEGAGGGRTGVLLLHGFTGSPASVTPWGRVLADQGWTVRVPRLPGHGTSWQDMNRTRWQDWYGEADRAFRQVRERCDRVVVMGLSMGGTLTLRLAEQHGAAIAGLVLVNPAVHSERPDRFLLPVLQAVVPSFPGISNDIAKPGQDEVAYDRIPLKAAHSLTALWKVVKADIARVDQPLLLFRSAQDHVVEPSNAAWVQAHVSSTDVEDVLLPNSFHVATLDHDADVIHRESIAFVERLGARAE